MDKKAIFDKYGFLIVMVVSVVIFGIFLGTKDIIKYNETKKIAEQESKENKGKKVIQSDTGEIQIVTDESGETQTEAVTEEKQHRDFVTVDESYLDGALFIGDSRTQTISLYANWDKTVFYAEQGVSVWKILDEKIVKSGKKKITVKKALEKNKFEKIYIMLGINEIGTGTADTFAEQYGKVINTIREKQPDAIIFIQSIMHVTKKKDKEETYIKNKEIDKRNKKLKKLTNGYDIIWLDENEVFDKKDTGALDPKYTSDGVHLMPSCVPRWKQFFLEHGIVK